MTIVSATTRKFGALLAAGLLATLLVACGATDSSEPGRDAAPPVNNIVNGEPTTPTYVASVDLLPGQSLDELAALAGGTAILDTRRGVLGTSSTASQATVGFIGFDSLPLNSQSLASLGVDKDQIEVNEDRFLTSAVLETLGDSRVWAESDSGASQNLWAEGDSRIWAEGDSRIWAEGDSRIWAEGDSRIWAEGRYRWMPPNSTNWSLVNLRGAHSEARGRGDGVIVAVIDTGIDFTHQAFLNDEFIGATVLSTDGWDFVDNDGDPSEVGTSQDIAYGHGTIVAGIIRQIAPAATILPIRALSADGSGNVLDVVRAVYFAVEKGARVINLSMGGPADDPSPALAAAILHANDNGVFVTISAGNNDAGLSFPAVLAGERNYRYVASVTSLSSDRSRSVFSNYGREASIAAPGELIYGPYPDEGIGAWSGTSMAAPVVAGALALALGEKLDSDYRGRRAYELYELLEEMYEESRGIYGVPANRNLNRNGSELLGAGLIDIEEFLDEVID